jgi:hypothetical protein
MTSADDAVRLASMALFAAGVEPLCEFDPAAPPAKFVGASRIAAHAHLTSRPSPHTGRRRSGFLSHSKADREAVLLRAK